MRVTCPSCLTEYELPPDIASALAGDGRHLRCADCGHVWLEAAPASPAPVEPAAQLAPSPEAPAAPAPAPAADEPTIAAVERLAPPAGFVPLPPVPAGAEGRPAAGRVVWIGWVVSLVVVAGMLAGLWLDRRAVMQAVPATVPLYAALGGAATAGAPPAHR